MRWPVLLTIIATLALAAVAAGCGGGGGSGSSEDAEALLNKAFAQEVDSADLKIDMSADLEGVQQLNGPISLTIEGPYKSQGKEKLPLFDWDVSVQGGGQSFAGGLVVTADNAFVEFQGTNYEVGTELFQQFAAQVEEQGTQGPQRPQGARRGPGLVAERSGGEGRRGHRRRLHPGRDRRRGRGARGRRTSSTW